LIGNYTRRQNWSPNITANSGAKIGPEDAGVFIQCPIGYRQNVCTETEVIPRRCEGPPRRPSSIYLRRPTLLDLYNRNTLLLYLRTSVQHSTATHCQLTSPCHQNRDIVKMLVRKLLESRGPQFLRLWTAPTKAAIPATRAPSILPSDVLVEEEQIPGYDPKHFYPVNPGDIFHNRYEMLAKVGWGTSSTVWLARDTQRYVLAWLNTCHVYVSHLCRWWWQSNRYVALKVIASRYIDQDSVKHELNIDRRLKTNPSHNGFLFVRTTLESFEVTGPDDGHFCLVYEPLREPLWIFQRRWEDGKLPPSIAKVYTRFLLQGLNYLHSECHVIHTGGFMASLDVNVC